MKCYHISISVFLLVCFFKLQGQHTLNKGDRFNRTLVKNESHSYEVLLEEGQFFFASVMGEDIDLTVTVFDPKGKQILEFDDNGVDGEFIPITALEPGKYTFDIAPYNEEEAGGTYQLAVLRLEEMGATVEHKLDQLFSYWNDEHHQQKPGVAVAVVKEGKSIYRKAFGLANLEYNIPLSSSSVFDIASLAKQFTGMAIAMLVEQKKLLLTDNIRKYLPEVPDVGQIITVENLLHHTSGLRDFAGMMGMSAYTDPLTSNVVLDILKHQQSLNFPTGEAFEYSNTNYVLLAIIVERITNMDFSSWMKEHIFEPLEMTNSFANSNPYRLVQGRAMGYNSEGEKIHYMQNNGMSLIGSSAVYSTLDDLIGWVKNFDDAKVGGKGVLSMIHRKGTLANGDSIDYCFGLSETDYQGIKMYEHSGSTPSGFRTLIARFPDHELSFIVLSNWGNVDPISMFGIPMIEILLKDHLQPPPPSEEEEIMEVPNEQVSSEIPARSGEAALVVEPEEYVGDYFSPELRVLYRINKSDEKLILSYPRFGEQWLEMSETDKCELPSGLFSQFEFQRGDHGEIIGFLVSTNHGARNIVFEKL